MNFLANFWKSIFEARSAGTSAAMSALNGAFRAPGFRPLSPQPCADPISNTQAPAQPCPPVSFTPPSYTNPCPQSPCPPSFQSTIGVAQGLAIVPQVIVKTFFDTLCSPAAQYNPCAPDYAAPWTTNSSTQYIVEEANRYLSAVPGGGALLNDLVEQVTLRTRADSTTVRSVIMRNFSSNGLLVWKGTERASQGTVVSQMGAQLQRLGYTDLEYDYRLTAVPERNDVAALVALDAGNPIILCYPVARGQVDDPLVREAAYFQAAAISPAKSARYVWVSDGAIDFFFDSQTSSVLTALPARPAVAA